MKRLFAIAALIIAASIPGMAQGLVSQNGDCALGGQAISTQGLKSVGTLPIGGGSVASGSGVIGSFPRCSVTVYFTGTTNKPNLFSNNLSTPTPLGDPFNANTDGTWLYFVAPGCYDVILNSGSGPPMPSTRTLTSVCLGSSNNPAVTLVTFSATPTFAAAPFATFQMTLTGNVTSSTITNSINGEIVHFNLCQDGTGGRTLAWPASFLRPPTISSVANSCTNSAFVYDGTNWRGLWSTGDTLVPTSGGISGTWPGAPIWTGNHTFQGINNFTNSNIFSGPSNTICRLSGSRVVDAANTCGWTGSDIGAWINAAYSDCPAGTCPINLAASTSTYNFSTPITLTTQNKPVLLQCFGATNAVSTAGCVLNYTPTTATAALTLDYFQNSGGGYTPQNGIRGITLVNNGCATVGGCGSSATGILIGSANAGAAEATFADIKVQGFGTGFSNTNPTSWGEQCNNCSFVYNTTGVNIGSLENIKFFGGTISVNGTGITDNNGELYVTGVSFDSNTSVAVTCTNGPSAVVVTLSGNHFENNAQANTHYVTGNCNFFFSGGIIENDNVGGSSDYMVSVGGAVIDVKGVEIASSQSLTTGFFNLTGIARGFLSVYNQTPTSGNTICAGNTTNCTVFELHGTASTTPTPWYFESPLAGAQANHGLGIAGPGVTSGFTATGQLHIKGNTATLDSLVLEDTNNPRKIAFGPGTGGGGGVGLYDATGAKVLFFCSWLTFNCTIGPGAGGGGLFLNGAVSGQAGLFAPSTGGVNNTLPSTAGTLPVIIAIGTATMTTAAITAGNCGTTVTVAATGVLTTDTITVSFNAAPAGSNAGLVWWPTANNVNFAYCPNTAETPAAATINWKVQR